MADVRVASRVDDKHSTNDNEFEKNVYRHKRVAYNDTETVFEDGVQNSSEVCIAVELCF